MNILLGTTDGDAEAPFSADLESILGKKLLIQAMSGAGKSWLIRRILEQVFGQVQIIVLDSEGDFRTLRERYPYVLAGGDQGDVPVSVELARPLAHKLLELRTSSIIDISDLSVGRKENERCDFVSEFLTALLASPQKLWHPTLVVLDEAQEFAPERFSASSTEAVIKMAGQARKRGFGFVLATNRLSELSKSAAAHCKSKLIGGSMGIDAQKAAFELGLPPRDRAFFQDLDEGQFYAIGPAFEKGVHLVQIGDVETTHPSPSGRELAVIPPAPKEVEKALAELAALRPPPVQEEEPPKQKGQPVPAVCDHQEELDNLRTETTRLTGKIEEAETAVAKQTKELEQSREDAAKLRALRIALNGVVSIGPPTKATYTAFDEEEFLQKVLARIPANGQTVSVTPPEALRKKYLNDAVDRAYESISELSDKHRQAMEVLLSQDLFWSATTVATAIGGRGATGGALQGWKTVLEDLAKQGLAHKGGSGRGQFKATVKEFAQQELSVHSPTDQEVDAVVGHVLAKVVTG